LGGDETTDLLVSMVDAINDLTVQGDIKLLSISINNTNTPTPINDLIVNPSINRHAIVEYAIYRVSSTTELSQVGTFWMTYYSNSGVWQISDVGSSNALVDFTADNAGQVYYTAQTIGGTGYTGALSCRARVYPA